MRLTLTRRTATSLLVAGTMFMEILDSTVITTALPAIAKDFNTAAAHLSLGVSAYLVALTMFIPISGWAADRYGARRIFSLALVIFTLASVLCALCSNLTEFTFARVLQGLGGAMMVPVGRLVVLRDTPKQQLVRAIAILTWPALAAPLIGPVLGGWIASHWSWHWIFILNVPLGVIALIATQHLIPIGEQSTKDHFDLRGFLLSASGFGLFMAGIEASSREDMTLTLALSLLVVGLVILAVTTRHLLTACNPLFNLKPLAVETFRLSVFGGSLFRIAISTAPFLLPLMFQLGFGFSPVEAGALLLWLFAGNFCMKPATTWIMNRFGFKRVLVTNGFCVALGFAAMTQFTSDTPVWAIIIVLFISGMCRSLQFTAMNTISYSDMPKRYMRDANTLQAVFIQMNIGVGIAVGALALAVACWVHGGSSTQPELGDFQLSLWFVSVLALLAMFDSILLPKDAGFSVLKSKQAT